MSSRSTARSLRACLVALTLLSPLAHAGRNLDEPAGIGKIVKGAPRPDVDKAVTAAGLGERCSKDALKALDLLGLECRATLATALLHAKPVDTKADLDVRTALFTDLLRTATQVSSWEPLAPPPGLGRARFDAHRAVSRALFGLYDDLVMAQAKAAARTDIAAWLATTPDPKTQTCLAAQRSVELALGGDATASERGEAQSLLTSHACFLDESRLRSQQKPGEALRDSKDAAALAAQTSGEATVLEYATSRTLDLERCGKHLDAAGHPKDAAKLEQCACGAIGRWKLPPRPKATSTTIPVSGLVGVAVEVAPGGAVARCGPLSVKP